MCATLLACRMAHSIRGKMCGWQELCEPSAIQSRVAQLVTVKSSLSVKVGRCAFAFAFVLMDSKLNADKSDVKRHLAW